MLRSRNLSSHETHLRHNERADLARSAFDWPLRTRHPQGRGLGGPDLVYCYEFNEIPRFARLPTARSVHRAKALRSTLQLAIARGTTKSFFESEVASCCPWLMRARCTPQAMLAACCSAWLRRSFRHDPRLRIGRQGEYYQHTLGRVPERIWIARR